ncbi:TPA: glycerol-3-phosphate acyltransferase, partial [Streptococcus agalactiae]
FAPSFFLYLLVIFLLTLYLFSMISLSSITVAVVGILSVLIFPLVGFILTDYDWIFTTVVILMALTIIIRHQDNIKRIRKRQENLVPFGLNLSKQKNK